MRDKGKEIARRRRLTGEEFAREYVRRERPVVISGVTRDWPALQEWGPEYFGRKAPGLKIQIKEYGHGGVRVSAWTMRDYADFLVRQREAGRSDDDVLPYCHDIPLFSLIASLPEDVSPFPTEYLPRWYRDKWWRYVQFFMGPSNSLTPLHFDTLLTHNLFIQVTGRKRFTILAPEDAKYCAVRGWRWFDVDPERPDFERHPQYRRASPAEVIVDPGDILYLPPGTLHHVRSLETAISFNIDFHTRRSAVRGLLAAGRGMPMRNLYYNSLCAAGLVLNVPADLLFRFYKPYLSYIS